MKNNMYKIVSVTIAALWKEFLGLFEIIANIVRNEDGTLDDDYRMRAHAAFESIYNNMLTNINLPFIVDRDDCVVNTAKQSILSNIMGVPCGTRETTVNIISVSHRLFEMIISKCPWQVVDLNQQKALAKVEMLQKAVMKRLTAAGVDIVTGVTRRHYGFIVSTPSQQKTGGMYMGLSNVMALEQVQRALNFNRTFKDFNLKVPTTAVEWLKVNALSATPADPTEYSLRKIIVMPAIKIKKLLKNVCRVNGDGSITHLKQGEIEQEMIDGQFLWFKPVRSGQLRGWCFKAFGARGDLIISLVDNWEDIIVNDVDGNPRRLGDAVGICTDSCWKGTKFFSTYTEYCNAAEELAKYIPSFDKIWVVREVKDVDNDGEEIDYGRRLSRQATQQWVDATTLEIFNLTEKTRNKLNGMKTYDGLLKVLSNSSKKIEDRSDLDGLIENIPDLITTEALQNFAKTSYEKKQLSAAANRIHVNGNYPFICMDPVAMIQVLVLNKDPNDPNLGLLKAGEVYNPKYKDRQKLYAIRYPANYITGTILRNHIFDIYRCLGDVAVLPWHGDTIIREDGDFDGDEMMFCPDKLVIDIMERTIHNRKPELIDFDHGRKAKMAIWETRDNRFFEIGEALWRAMRYNLVGAYSNMAVKCFHIGNIEDCILMHVMAILCLDMVKGTVVPDGLVNKAESVRRTINKKCDGAMPWNQIFRDKLFNITGRKYMEADFDDTVDKIASMIMSTGDYSFDAENHSFGDQWKLMANGTNTTTRKGVVPAELANEICEFYSRSDMEADDLKIYNRLKAGEMIGVGELLYAASVNESSMVYTCSGDTLEDKRDAYRELIREAAFSIGRGRGLSDALLQDRVVNYAARSAATCSCPSKSEDRKAKYGLFLLRVFATDFLHNVERNLGVDKFSTFEFRREAAIEAKKKGESVMDFTDTDLSIDEIA